MDRGSTPLASILLIHNEQARKRCRLVCERPNKGQQGDRAQMSSRAFKLHRVSASKATFASGSTSCGSANSVVSPWSFLTRAAHVHYGNQQQRSTCEIKAHDVVVGVLNRWSQVRSLPGARLKLSENLYNYRSGGNITLQTLYEWTRLKMHKTALNPVSICQVVLRS
jgi:hypothetical protein